jgi:amino acid adenylation domain-containing protein
MNSEPLSNTLIEGFELSPQQARLWQWQQACFPTDSARVAVLCLRLPGTVEEARLRQSLEQMVSRHEILQTRYRRLPGMARPVQVIEPQPAVAWQTPEEPLADGLSVVLTTAPGGHARLQLRLPAAHGDIASLHLLAAEWARTYLGQVSADAPLQYADYAAWRSDLPASHPEARAFWEREIAAGETSTVLPLRGPQPAFTSPVDLAALRVPVTSAAQEQWLRQCVAWGVDPALLALAAWIALLHQHGSAERLTLGLDWQARGSHLGDALGLFSEPLPLTLETLEHDDTATLCRVLHHRSTELLEWRDYFPGPAQDTPYALGFRHVPPLDDTALVAAGWEIEYVSSPTAVHHLLLECRARRGQAGEAAPELVLHYDQALYDATEATMLAEQLATLLEDACRNPAHRLHELSALSAGERHLVTEVFSRPAPLPAEREQDYARITSLPNLTACLAGDAWPRATELAVQGASGGLRHAELDEQSARLAQALLARDVAVGRRVAHFLPRDIDAIVAMLAICRAGASYVPVDPSYPASRIAFMLDDCGADVILTRRELVARLPKAWQDSKRLLFTDAPVTPAATLPWPAIRPEHEAYLIYTSGSTGQPKGVPITHAGALHSLAARIAYYSDPVRHFLLLSSFSFDSSIAGLFWTLAQGGCLHVCTEAEQKDPMRLASLIQERGITHLLALPSLYQALLEPLAGQSTTLATAIVAGEVCPRPLVEAHHRALPETHLYNEYGPTEAAVWSTVAACTPGPASASVPIGRPIPHGRVYLLDGRGQPVARGLAGEIHVGGPGLSPGYLRRPELTAEKFVHLHGERLYRTGDHACWDAHGALLFLGRSDAQVKIRGYRIELGEVEVALQRVSGVEQVVVLAARGEDGQTSLRGFLASPAPLEIAAVRHDLTRLLPDYMIPADLQVLPALPRLANGKIDRNALLALGVRRERAAYAAPQGHTEHALAALWEELLGSENVSRHDHFFALGGHSLLVVRLVHRIKTALHVELPVSTVFEHPTLAALATQLDPGATHGPLVRLRPGSEDHPPLVCLHQPSGHVSHYLPLVEHLPAEQPVYGIPLPPGCNGDNTTINELAIHYMSHVRSVQPHGPYHLCGWSMGGLLALELARQLEQAGERVAFLALIDTTFRVEDEPLPLDDLLRLCRAELVPDSAEQLDTLPADTLHGLRSALAGQGKLAQVRHVLLEWAPRQGLRLAAPQEVVQATLQAMHDARRWVASHDLAAVTTDIHFWWAADTLARDSGLPQAWEAMSRGASHHVIVPGNHDEILRRAELHESFCACLEQIVRGRA